jgi:hypothetical protein
MKTASEKRFLRSPANAIIVATGMKVELPPKHEDAAVNGWKISSASHSFFLHDRTPLGRFRCGSSPDLLGELRRGADPF